MKHLFLTVCVIISFSNCTRSMSPPIQPIAPPAQLQAIPSVSDYYKATTIAAATITSDKVHKHIEFLASDDLRGRDTPSPGLEEAAEYLSTEFENFNLTPAGNDNTFFQRFPYTRTAMLSEQRLLAYENLSVAHELEFGRDYYIIPGQQIADATEAIFGGSVTQMTEGIASEIQGKTLILATNGNPMVESGEALLSAFQTAMQGGASAIVFLLDETNTSDSILSLASGIEGAGLATPIPIVGLSAHKSQELFEVAGLNLSSLIESPPQNTVSLNETVMTVIAPFKISEHTPPNVIAIIRGDDPVLRNEYIVYSAHFDHVGIGIPSTSGDSIYNGADDDASGTSVLLEVARAFATMKVPPARSVIFLAVSGEEKGLLGSKFFSENPTVPIDDIIMNINLDMVGRNHPDTVVAVGRQYTNLGLLTDRILQEHPELGLTAIEDPKPEEKAFFRSDHLNFVNKDIPAIFFTTWLHDDYHKPSDETHLIDSEKTSRIAKMVFYLGALIASGEENPEWKEEGLAEVKRIIAQNGN